MSSPSDNSHNSLSRNAAWKVAPGKRVYYHDKICYQPWTRVDWCVWFSLASAPHSFTLQLRRLLIMFDRLQTITNGIIYFSLSIYIADTADRPPDPVSHSLETRQYVTHRIHMEDIYLCCKTFSSLWIMREDGAAPGACRLRVTYSEFRLWNTPLINLKRPNSREVGGCFGPRPRVTQHILTYDCAAPPSAVWERATFDAWEVMWLELLLETALLTSAELRTCASRVCIGVNDPPCVSLDLKKKAFSSTPSWVCDASSGLLPLCDRRISPSRSFQTLRSSLCSKYVAFFRFHSQTHLRHPDALSASHGSHSWHFKKDSQFAPCLSACDRPTDRHRGVHHWHSAGAGMGLITHSKREKSCHYTSDNTLDQPHQLLRSLKHPFCIIGWWCFPFFFLCFFCIGIVKIVAVKQQVWNHGWKNQRNCQK